MGWKKPKQNKTKQKLVFKERVKVKLSQIERIKRNKTFSPYILDFFPTSLPDESSVMFSLKYQ